MPLRSPTRRFAASSLKAATSDALSVVLSGSVDLHSQRPKRVGLEVVYDVD